MACQQWPYFNSISEDLANFQRFIRDTIFNCSSAKTFLCLVSALVFCFSSPASCALFPLFPAGPAQRSLLCQLNKVIQLGRVLALVVSRVLLIDIFSILLFYAAWVRPIVRIEGPS